MLLQASSYEAVGIRDIWESAGIPKDNFYYWFRSREELRLAVVDQDWEATTQWIYEPNLAPTIPALERFDRYPATLRNMPNGWDRAYGCPFGNIGTESTRNHPTLQRAAADKLAEMNRHSRRTIDDAITAGDIPDQDSARTADAGVALVEGMVLFAEIYNDVSVPDGLAPRIRALIGAPT